MQAHGRHGQIVLLAQLAHLHEVHEVLDVLLHLVKPHEILKLRHELVKVGLLLLLRRALLRLFAAGGLELGLVLLLKARLPARDVVEGVQPLPALAHTARVADGGEAVAAFGDVGGLLVRHVVVHGGEVKQDVREHADEGAGGLAAAFGVALRQVPEEHRRHEHVLLHGGAGKAPQEPLGLGLVAGIDLVCHRHVALGDAARAAPERKGALGHEFVQLLGQPRAAHAVEGVGVGEIDLVKLLGGTVPGGRHIGSLLLFFFFCNYYNLFFKAVKRYVAPINDQRYGWPLTAIDSSGVCAA